MSHFRKWTEHPLFWPCITLLLLCLVNFYFNHGFFHVELKSGHLYGSVVDILNRAAPLMLIAMGMTLVIATGGIDISVGAVVAISGAVVALLISGTPANAGAAPMMLAIAAALGAAVLCGVWNGVLVSGFGMQPIIATLILMVAGRGIAQLISGGQIITVYYEPFYFIGNGFLWGIPFSLYLVLGMLLILTWAMRRTALGLFIKAVGINPTAAFFAGVNARALIFGVYAFCGLAAGIAGLIVCSNVKSADGNNAGLLLELDAILAVTLGGTSLAGGKFSLAGSLIGALIIQSLTYAIYSIGVPPEVNMVVKAIVVFGVCLIQSDASRTMVLKLVQRRQEAA